jgi:hypothetical protein
VVPGALTGRSRSIPVPLDTTAPPWGTGPTDVRRVGPPGGGGRVPGSEVFARPGGPRPGAVVGTVVVLALVVVVLVLSFTWG